MAKTTSKKKIKRGTCRDCGCTDDKGCIVDRQGRTCGWADITHTLCTSCLFDREEAKRIARRISAAEDHPALV